LRTIQPLADVSGWMAPAWRPVAYCCTVIESRVTFVAPPETSPPLEAVSAAEHRAGKRLQRVELLGLVGLRDRALDLGQLVEERADGRKPVTDGGPGCIEDQRAQRREHLRQVGGEIEPLVALQPLPQRIAIGCGWSACQQVVPHRTESEHVDLDAVHLAQPHTLRCLVDPTGRGVGTVHEVEDRGPQGGYQPRSWAGRGPAGTAGGLPVGHHDLDRTVGAVQDEHRRRGQVAVYDTMAVGVADCFADLAQQVELGGEWDALRMVCEPEVEAAELGAQRVDQAMPSSVSTRSRGRRMPSWLRAWTARNSCWPICRRRRWSSTEVPGGLTRNLIRACSSRSPGGRRASPASRRPRRGAGRR
jgi:hypothetical protein